MVRETGTKPRGASAFQAPASARKHCVVDSGMERRLGSKMSFSSLVYPVVSVHHGEDLVDPGEERVPGGHDEEVRISYLGVEVAVELHHSDYLFVFDPLQGLSLLTYLI